MHHVLFVHYLYNHVYFINYFSFHNIHIFGVIFQIIYFILNITMFWIQILIHTSHSGHIPNSDEDVHFLPLHPMAKEKVKENLHNLNDVQSALSAARRRAGNLILQEF